MVSRLEFAKGGTNKFWQIKVVGSSHIVTYGRIETKGQTKTKSFPSPTLAKKAAEKLLNEKLAKGYQVAKKAGRVTKKPVSKKIAGSIPIAVLYNQQEDLLEFLFLNDAELWCTTTESTTELLDDGQSLSSVLDLDWIERWKFKTALKAKQACDSLLKTQPFKSLPLSKFHGDLSLNLRSLSKHLKQKRFRLPRLEKSKSGPIEVSVHHQHDWRFPRPPMPCLWCGAPMLPGFSINGNLGNPFSKQSKVFVNGCPGVFPRCESSMEVVYQDEKSDFGVDKYLVQESQSRFVHLHLTKQWQFSSARWGVVIHQGDLGVPGYVTFEPCENEKDAKLRMKAISKEFQDKGLRNLQFKAINATKIHTQFKKSLAELYQCNRRQLGSKRYPYRSFRFKAKPVYSEFEAMAPTNGGSFFCKTQKTILGGSPSMIQSNFGTPYGIPNSDKMVFVAQSETQSQLASPVFDYGDMGSIYAWVDPAQPFGCALMECG